MKVYNLLIALMLSMSLFSSCACEEDAATDESAVIRLSLGTGATKTNAALPADNGGTVGANEGKINTVCVGIFDSSDYLLTLHEYTYSGDENITTTTRAAKMVLVANVPAGQFKDVNTRSGFLAKVQSLAYTTSTNGLTDANKTSTNNQTLTALPMYAETPLSSLSTTSKTALPITLSRVVSRVVLKSLTVGFGSTVGFTGATFVPKEIFMYNVNDQYQWTGIASSSATNLSGEMTTGAAGALTTVASNSAYLSSGLLTMAGAAGTKTYLSTTDNPYFFYVFPHSATTPTKLVIKGIYYPKGGSEATGEVMYYPIIINHSQTGTTITDTNGTLYTNGVPAYSKDSQLAANTTYNLSVTIQGRGVTDMTQDIIPSSAIVTMTVANWTSITYPINTFTPAKAYPGNFYYNDGSWGTSATPTDGRTAIGVVFSNQTSTADKAYGWTHGYAMALTNATSNVAWSSSVYASTQEFNSLVTALADYETELSGYDHCQTILNKEKAKNNSLSTFSTDYPAVYYALNYGTSSVGGTQYAAPTATNNSGWYLPSCGQWYLIVKTLGNVTTQPGSSAVSDGMTYWYWTSMMASTASSGINSYLSKVVSGGNLIDWSYSSNATTSRSYSCSSERSASYMWYMSLGSDGYLYTSFGTKTNTSIYTRIRSVIAF